MLSERQFKKISLRQIESSMEVSVLKSLIRLTDYNVNDIYDFVNRSNNVVAPLISRVLSARQQILLATQNHVDILDQQEYANLRKLIN